MNQKIHLLPEFSALENVIIPQRIIGIKKNIALAMVVIDKSEVGTEFVVEVLSKKVNAVVVEKPFYDPKKKIASS